MIYPSIVLNNKPEVPADSISTISHKRSPTMQLNNGDQFPDIQGPTIGGDTLSIPSGLEHEWNAVLFYRGHW